MATGRMIVNVVDVGQGQCTFVEIYDTTNTLASTLLFDCGSDHKSDTTLVNLQYIAKTVESMATPAFDLVVFSHSDKDHISLMKDLLAYCQPTRPVIRRVVYGGNRAKYTKNHYNILSDMVSRRFCDESDLVSPNTNSTGFIPPEGRFGTPLWTNADQDVRVDLLVGNVISDEPDDDDEVDTDEDVPLLKGAEALNRVSLVCRVTYNGHDYIICGDATNRTMGWVNWYFHKRIFAYVPMLTVPHHGSRATGLSVPSGQAANDLAISTVRTFAKICNGRTLTASSYAKHGHPSMELIQYLLAPMAPKPLVQDTRTGANSHSLVSYVDLNLPFANGSTVGTYAYRSYYTQTNLYGTNYYNPDYPTGFAYNYGNATVGDGPTGAVPALNPHACWVYGSDSLKNDTLLGACKLPATTTGPYPTVFTAPPTKTILAAIQAPSMPQGQPSLRPATATRLARLRTFR